MSDIFREVDEEVRRDQLKKIWDRYGSLIIAVAVAILIGVAGWRAYEYFEAKRAAEAGAQFEAALALSDQGKSEEAQAAFAKIATEGASGYRALARLREVGELAQRDPKAAIQAYDKLATDAGLTAVLQELATLRAGTLLVDHGTYEEVRTRLEPLAASGRTFRHTAREMLVLGAWRANDIEAMRKWYDALVTDAETPQATRGRAELLMALVPGDAKG